MKEKMINFIQKYKIWIIGGLILPLATVGYDYLETTNFYNTVTGTNRLNSAIKMLYSSDPGLQNGLFIESATSSREFISLSKLVRSEEDITSDFSPTFISRWAIKNAPYVNIPTSLDKESRFISDSNTKQLILGTDFSPTILASCKRLESINSIYPECKVRIIGNRYELEHLIDERKKTFRFKFNILVTSLAILLSFSREKSKSLKKL